MTVSLHAQYQEPATATPEYKRSNTSMLLMTPVLLSKCQPWKKKSPLINQRPLNKQFKLVNQLTTLTIKRFINTNALKLFWVNSIKEEVGH